MPLLVTSASGTNGNGFGALLAFDSDGKPVGAFSDDSRIVDPRGLSVVAAKGCCFSTAAAIACWRSAPMPLIDGMFDPTSGAHMVTHFRELVPKAKVTELAGIGHYPQVQAPREVLAAYLSFRNEVDAHLAVSNGQRGE